MFWEGDKTEIVEADKNPFSVDVKMVEAIFYSPHLHPIQAAKEYEDGSWSACNLTAREFEISYPAKSRP